VQRSSILLQVTDATSPTAAEQMAQVESVLRELDAADKPQIHVLNKIDLFDAEERAKLKDTETSVHISAARGFRLERLLAAIDARLDQDPIERARLRVPQSEGKALAQLESRSIILSRQYADGEMVELEVDAPESLLRRLSRFVVDGAAVAKPLRKKAKRKTAEKPKPAGE
jgi:GTP-binding protein HflX